MSKIRITTLFALASLLFLSACGGNATSSTTVADRPTNLLEYEQRTLEQAKALEETLKKSFDDRLGSLK
ncbi:MAG: hypothetical protein KAH03_05385 [Cocleimonas sp.]|nr:hypothetical protein [Cocleimonas sp.]